MNADDELDARLRLLTRRVVETAPAPPELDLEPATVRSMPGGGRRRAPLLLAAASVLVLAGIGVAVALSRRGAPQAVQAGGVTVALSWVELPGGRRAVQTPGLPPLVPAEPVGSRPDARCFTPAEGGARLCVLPADNGIGASLAALGQGTALLVGLPAQSALVDITVGGTTVSQRPIEGIALLDVSALRPDLQDRAIEVVAYDERGVELVRTTIVDPATVPPSD